MTARVTIVDNGKVVLDEEIDTYSIDNWASDDSSREGALKVVATRNYDNHADLFQTRAQQRLEDEAAEAILELLTRDEDEK